MIFALGNIFFYNKVVNLLYLISTEGEEVQNLQTSNAELKNQLYQITDPQKLQALAQERGLIKIKNPDYLEVNESVSLYNDNR